MGTVSEKIALVTVLFDYPEHYMPSFYKNACKWFDEKDIHVFRFNNEVIGSYYDKLRAYKIDKLKERLDSLSYEYILFLDATDTNFVKEPVDIIDRFKEYGCNILMGAEKGMWPPTEFSGLYEQKKVTSSFRYLNSGTYFGYLYAVKWHLNNIIKSNYQNGIDDQGQWSIEYLLHDDIKLDTEQRLFYSTYQSKDGFVLEQGLVNFNYANPFIIHDNGGHDELTTKLTEYINENS